MLKREFMQKAKPLTAEINGRQVLVDPKSFSTGSVGWHFQGKVPVTLADGSTGQIQLQISGQLVGSKEKKPDDHVTTPVTTEPEVKAEKPSSNGVLAHA